MTTATLETKPMTTAEIKPFMAKLHKPVSADLDKNKLGNITMAWCNGPTYTDGGRDTGADVKYDVNF